MKAPRAERPATTPPARGDRAALCWLLVRWDRHTAYEISVHSSEDSGLSALMTHVHSSWANVSHEDDVPDTPPGDDRLAAHLYYSNTHDEEGYDLYQTHLEPEHSPAQTAGQHTGRLIRRRSGPHPVQRHRGRRRARRARHGQLRIVPVDFATAAAFVLAWHRHLPAPRGHKFSLGVADDDNVLRGVAIAGRPVARHLDDGLTLEVTRTATDGTPNAVSALYAAAWRAARELGYRKLVTYTHTRLLGPVCPPACTHPSCHAVRLSESGSSLRGAGWRVIAHRPARPGWHTRARPRHHGAAHIPRTLWEPLPDSRPDA